MVSSMYTTTTHAVLLASMKKSEWDSVMATYLNSSQQQ